MNSKVDFLSSLDEMTPQIAQISGDLSDNTLAWVSSNRDFGEDERYREKDEVDLALIQSKIISSERRAIEQIFNADDSQLIQLENYRRRLDHILERLQALLMSAADVGQDWTAEDHLQFWLAYADLADADNAHAMYLSSGNWDFSVFDNVLNAIMALSGSDKDVFSAILTGGMLDVRTAIYDVMGTTYEGMDREQFVAAVRANHDWTRPGGYVTIMCFGAATGDRGRPGQMATEDELSERFDAATEFLAAKHPDVAVVEIVGVYRALYDLRRRYDIYEYFGAYAYYRNIAIHRFGRCLDDISPSDGDRLRYLATTYQFGPLTDVLRRMAA